MAEAVHNAEDVQLAERKQDCRYDLDAILEPLLYRYGPVILREQLWRWLERAPRNRAELIDGVDHG